MTAFEPSERYTVDQALSHPWITRNFKENVPLTGLENIKAFNNLGSLVMVNKKRFFDFYLKKQK